MNGGSSNSRNEVDTDKKEEEKEEGAPYTAHAKAVDSLSFFPNFKMVTANIDGIGTDAQKKMKTIKYLDYLLSRFDIACITEARAHDLEAIRHSLKGCALIQCLVDKSKKAEAGVFIAVRQQVLEQYDIDSVYRSNTLYGKGRIVSITLKPKTGSKTAHSTSRITCAYIKSGDSADDVKEKLAQLNEIFQINKTTDFEFIGGI